MLGILESTVQKKWHNISFYCFDMFYLPIMMCHCLMIV